MRLFLCRWFSTVLLVAWLSPLVRAEQKTIVIDTRMTPPAWALLERELLRENSLACERFAAKYLDHRGYLLHTPRWGTLDGPDDAIETFFNWTLLHALGGSDAVLEAYKRAQEGHWKQYGELRTVKTELAKNGAYHKEFITMSDWFHTGEGMRAFMFLGLSEPTNRLYAQRMKRFSGLYMNEDPDALNYDPVHKVIKSIWNGSLGPMLRKATVYDWVGDPVPGKFHLLHNPSRRTKLLDLMAWYPRMLAHCEEYLDSVGDNFLNLAATNLALNAYMLTGEKKYRDWVLEYVGAWRQRTEKNGGMIPSNLGLDGSLGGQHDGMWYKGTYGWNFTIFDGELRQIAHRNYFTAGSWPGFSNAYLLTGDPAYLGVLRKQMDLIYAQKKMENGKVLVPQMYGDPRGYKYSGREEWYHWTDNLHVDRLMEIYLWSMDGKDLERIPVEGWIGFLEGEDADYPEKALRKALSALRRKVEGMDNDPTTPDTRLADWLLGYSPAQTDTLVNLMWGGYFAKGRIWTLHSRFRLFDPKKRRSGAPEDVASLVTKLAADAARITLVNLNEAEPRTVVLQAGGYVEHRFRTATVNGKTVRLDAPYVTVRLEAGSGAELEFTMERYINQPTLAHPWKRSEAGSQ